jgi:glycosyltransferase involved in cell wall biosynthesis
VVTTEHSLWDKMAVLLRVLNRVTAPRDQALLVVSQPAYDALPPALQRRAQVMVHGVDLARSRDRVARRDVLRQEVRAELDVPDGDLLALTVANLRTEKGYDVLLDAARLAADRGDRIRFAAVGRGPLKEELEARHRALGLGEQFRFLGQRDDALRLLAGADVFVLTSHHEGLPVALMEAMSVGRATVATAVGGVAHVLTDGEDALVVPPRRPDAVVDALERLQADPALREVLGRGALARGADFDIAATTARVEDVYRRLVPVPGGVAPSPVPPTGSVSPPAR